MCRSTADSDNFVKFRINFSENYELICCAYSPCDLVLASRARLSDKCTAHCACNINAPMRCWTDVYGVQRISTAVRDTMIICSE